MMLLHACGGKYKRGHMVVSTDLNGKIIAQYVYGVRLIHAVLCCETHYKLKDACFTLNFQCAHLLGKLTMDFSNSYYRVPIDEDFLYVGPEI